MAWQTAYRVMFQQTKVNEKTRPLIVSDKEKENYICQNVQNLLYWNRYFVIYPHKCTLNNLKKKYQKKWENAYVTIKMQELPGPALGPWTLVNIGSLCYVGKIAEKFSGAPLWPNPGSASEHGVNENSGWPNSVAVVQACHFGASWIWRLIPG